MARTNYIVGELIKELQKYPADAPVGIVDLGGGAIVDSIRISYENQTLWLYLS
ncbi:hypothetical protein MTAT_19400 [Moorella thermoacetica]|uniref:Uncharacterized protein n=1 Tax=Neomoorella thermoacetica TaxID=1525 RepID=A0AAC9HI68_NEOTH|nr:hypothetical protein [Moorella thermoacetica]AOQ24597.1 hypothetical protein Maut_02167 [Moorella thermoacetica]TYL12698.1 hypothetical protein MTAT_19400 [Moorella thermoacetica]